MNGHRPSFPTILLQAIAALMLFFLVAPAANAQPATPPQEKVDELLRLMDDPDLRTWLDAQRQKTQPINKVQESDFQFWQHRARSQFEAAAAGLPKLPSELATAAVRVRTEAQLNKVPPVGIILLLMLFVGLAAEGIVRRILRGVWRGDPVLARTYVEGAAAGTFVVVTALALFAVAWPPMNGAVFLAYAIVGVILRLLAAVGAILIEAGGLSRFVLRRALLFCGILFGGYSLAMLAGTLSIDPTVIRAVFFVGSILLVLILMEAIWRRPDAANTPTRSKILQTICLVGLWVIWATGFRVVAWIGVLIIVLPGLLESMNRLTRAFAAARWPDEPSDSLKAVLLIHGVRTLILAMATVWLAYLWRASAVGGIANDAVVSGAITGLFRGVVILLIADFGWRVLRTLIDHRLASSAKDISSVPQETARRARFRTLLPILRNGLAALVLVITFLTILAQLGVEIGPLVAGAGIFGVAIGFGAQTLVKDVISGVFYLMDDAFRVGEYIQSGSYMGTVESFSLRSVKLRHHRGPVFTVPFGELGAVQNMSRDWVIDKFRLKVTFDADIGKVKKLTKAIGAELLKDEEIGQYIIETVKMKGVEQISEFGIDLSFAFTAAPSWQSVIRRRAYIMIHKAFQDNGIEFAQPKVQVGGDEKGGSAAAALTLATQQRLAAAEAKT